MNVIFRKKSQALLEKISFPIYYKLHLYIQKKRIKNNTNRLNSKFQDIKKSDFEKVKKSDTLFILGSGSSICGYNENMWNDITKGDSVGMNFWLVHDFVPNIYSLELPETEDSPQMKSLSELLILRSELYKNTKIYIKDIWRTSDNINIIPQELRKNVYIGEDYEIPGETKLGFSKSMRVIEKNENLIVNDKLILYKKKASISLWIYYGFIMGYKKIVLCGVDLNNTAYFYEQDSDYYKDKGVHIPASGQKGSVHKTLDPIYGDVTIDYVVREMNDKILKPSGINLYVGSKSSALYPELQYFWE